MLVETDSDTVLQPKKILRYFHHWFISQLNKKTDSDTSINTYVSKHIP
jgi:hypothetical protein